MIRREPAGPGVGGQVAAYLVELGVKVVGRVPREDLHRHFSQARVFALPTLLEAFGIVFVEALHFGLPIIGTTIGAVPEMVEDGVNG